MIKRIAWGTIVLLLAGCLYFGGAMIFGAESGPGSAADPLVTKSYVDERFEALAGEPGQSMTFQVIVVEAGQSLYGKEGTELILRGGQATAIDNGVDGLSDLTSGRDIRQGTTISHNHLLLVPRDDGRGIACVKKSWVMVKGAYTIR